MHFICPDRSLCSVESKEFFMQLPFRRSKRREIVSSLAGTRYAAIRTKFTPDERVERSCARRSARLPGALRTHVLSSTARGRSNHQQPLMGRVQKVGGAFAVSFVLCSKRLMRYGYKLSPNFYIILVLRNAVKV